MPSDSQREHLFGCFLAHQDIACIGCRRGINRYISLINVLNDSIFVDNKSGPIAEALFFNKDPVILDHCTFEITEQWKRNTDVLREAPVGRNAIDADTKNLSLGSFEFGDISLIRLQFFRSTAGKRQNIKSQHNIFLSFEVTQLHLVSGSAWQRKVGSHVTNFQVCLRRRWPLSYGYNSQG